jgi:hypothetical protein
MGIRRFIANLEKEAISIGVFPIVADQPPLGRAAGVQASKPTGYAPWVRFQGKATFLS